MKKIALFLLTPITLLSCNAKEKQLAGKWQAVYLDNPALTDMLVNQQHFIDTFGQNTTPEQNDSMYGVRNIDSMRQVLQMQIDSFRMMQEQTLQQTKFEFRSDKTALLYFGETPDSAHWYFDAGRSAPERLGHQDPHGGGDADPGHLASEVYRKWYHQLGHF
jgi:hypothetical protein